MADLTAHPSIDPAALVGSRVLATSDTRVVKLASGCEEVCQRLNRVFPFTISQPVKHVGHGGTRQGSMRVTEVAA